MRKRRGGVVSSCWQSPAQPNQTETMNETEKRKAAIAAMNAYISYAKKNAQEIANESAAMHVRYMASDETYEYTAEYLRRRNEADRLRKEVQP